MATIDARCENGRSQLGCTVLLSGLFQPVLIVDPCDDAFRIVADINWRVLLFHIFGIPHRRAAANLSNKGIRPIMKLAERCGVMQCEIAGLFAR